MLKKQYISRADFQLHYSLATASVNRPDGIEDEFDSATLRRGLSLIAQETRFAIFNLIVRNPKQLSLRNISEEIGMPRKKIYNHVYQMIRQKVIVPITANNGDEVTFAPNMRFLAAGLEFFGEH